MERGNEPAARLWLLLCCFVSVIGTQAAGGEIGSRARFSDHELILALRYGHQGYSLDEVLIRQDIRQEILARLIMKRPQCVRISRAREREIWHRLLNLRKAGRLPYHVRRRGKSVNPEMMPIAEMAARTLMDRHRLNSDRLLIDPVRIKELAQESLKIDPAANVQDVFKAVLTLRKRRRLRPELVLRVADWKRQVRTLPLETLRSDLQAGAIPASPGVYLFRAPEGYLYIGEAKDLRERLSTHLGHSDRVALGKYLAESPTSVSVELHQFESSSEAARSSVRRAYESELIRTRQPRFNVRP